MTRPHFPSEECPKGFDERLDTPLIAWLRRSSLALQNGPDLAQGRALNRWQA